MATATLNRERLWQLLAEVKDPEIPLNIVDLGLVVDADMEGTTAWIDLTFTTTACPCIDWIVDDTKERLLKEEGIDAVAVRIVWDPPWTVDRISEAGRRAMEHWGISA